MTLDTGLLQSLRAARLAVHRSWRPRRRVSSSSTTVVNIDEDVEARFEEDIENSIKPVFGKSEGATNRKKSAV